MNTKKRGRPPIPKENVRDETVQFRVSKTEKLTLQLKAAKAGEEFPDWCRKKLLDGNS